jgi:hypothetical protein
VAKQFQEVLQGDVLDVGCSERYLAEYVDAHYVGIDVVEPADVVVDLNHGGIPFSDGSFDCVVCTDVLEHLEPVHLVFDELLRCSRRWIIVSLPNAWAGLWRLFLHPGATPRFYGLPQQPPTDRHHWWFNADQAVDFIRGRSTANGATIELLEVWDGGSSWRRFLKRFLLITRCRYRNLGTTAVWAVIRVDAE